jgi:FkbM family methyltransferase
MYAHQQREFGSPRHYRKLVFEFREDTNDQNTLTASVAEDEYNLREIEHLEGHAIDVGGYLGSVGISLAVDHPELSVTIIEPVPDNFALIETNIGLNKVGDRVKVIHGAVGPASLKETTIHYGFRGSETATHHAFVGNASLLTRDQIGPDNCPSFMPHDHIQAKVYTLRSLLPADFIKIDCEGGEWTFMAKQPTTKVPHWVGEMHPIPGHVEGEPGSLRAEFESMLPGFAVSWGNQPIGGAAEFAAVRL